MNEAKKDILIGFFVFVLDIVLLYYFWENNVMLTATFFVISALVLIRWANKKEKILYFTVFVLAPIYDILLVPAGAWTYGNPTIFRVPIWLPLTYGISIVVIFKIGKSIAKLLK